MAEAANLPNFTAMDLPDKTSAEQAAANRFTVSVLEQHKREGLELAVRARWAALAVVAVMLPFLNPSWEVLYYEALILVVAGIGWLQRRVGRVGVSRSELAVLALDLTVMVFILAAPNPFGTGDWPTAFPLQFENFAYMYIILALGTLSYSWRTILAIGNWTAGLWMIALLAIWYFGTRMEELTEAAQTAFGPGSELARMLDPNIVHFDVRVQSIIIFMMVAGILAVTVRRFNRLLLGTAVLERERENLSRYFSPNVVEALSQNDEPLKEIRSHDVATIFVDIQGFTSFASERSPEDVIGTLREFHSLMERAVFAQEGTLDKYLGDGLMATFGTPFPRPDDVRRAYHCARRMVYLGEAWNAARNEAGDEPLGVSVGLHYGPVVVGDIGNSRLEFAVIGNTVNVASRLEALTRPLGAKLVVSEEVCQRLPEEETADLERVDRQQIRGIDGEISVWALR